MNKSLNDASALLLFPEQRISVIKAYGSTRTHPRCVTEMAGLSSYAVRMARLSARIFGDVVRPTDSKSMKVVQLFKEPPMAQKKEVFEWYPQHKIYYSLTQKLRYMGLFRDEHQDFKEEMRRLRKLRGKGKPKKGEGKRAMKKK
ncbi:28S ribosomal protein S33, mitochondrial [Silurus meridionalis]|nr:28S ribosomal protein S33, mitochondrial [Silurus meridionalis]